MLARVVGAEEKLTTGLELHAEVGLGSATVAAIRGGEGGGLGAIAVVTSASFSFVRLLFNDWGTRKFPLTCVT